MALLVVDGTPFEYMAPAGLRVIVNFYASQSDPLLALLTSTRVGQFFPRFPSVEATASSL